MEKTLAPRMAQMMKLLAEKGTLRPADIAEEMGISQPHVHTVLGKLTELGLTERIPLSYRLTKEGEETKVTEAVLPQKKAPSDKPKAKKATKKDKDPSQSKGKKIAAGKVTKPAEYELTDEEQEHIPDPEATLAKTNKAVADDDWE